MSYPGGKAGSGVYQKIISQMPPHDVYVEPFLGGAAVMARKLPARINIGIDADPVVVASIARTGIGRPGRLLLVGDAIAYLQCCRYGPSALVYCDPPYPIEVRTSQRRIYRCELSQGDHVSLIRALVRLDALVMVSGYRCSMYDEGLAGWRRVEYSTTARSGGRRQECLWCNFPEPGELHDYRYYGRDFRERERISRKRARWLSRLSKMPVLERRLLESAITEVRFRERNR